ncbi:MAG: hypothetical protein WCL08_00430 [Verrucomicrobiota bacterium]
MTLPQLLRQLVEQGGAIVLTSECSEMEIADARATGRMSVDDDGIGYVRRYCEWLAMHKQCVQPDSQNDKSSHSRE